MKKLLLAIVAILAECDVPKLVLPTIGVPLGPYCVEGGVVDQACLRECLNQYYKNLYNAAAAAVEAAANANDVYKAKTDACLASYMSCTDDCLSKFKTCNNDAKCAHKQAMLDIQAKLDQDADKAMANFYACANSCCYYTTDSQCEIPDLVPLDPTAPAGPYCRGDIDEQCLRDCITAYQINVRVNNALANAKHRRIITALDIAKAKCKEAFEFCRDQGNTDCHEKRDKCLKSETCFANRVIKNIQEDLDAAGDAAAANFYACVENCCEDV